MKKVFLGLVALALTFTACESDKNNDLNLDNQEVSVDMSDFSLYAEGDIAGKSGADKCHTMQNLAHRLEKNPGLAKKMYNIERNTRKWLANAKPGNGNGGGNGGGGNGGGGDTDVDVLPIDDGMGIINIPVYIHIVYPDANSITDAQVTSQMATLNADFRNPNINQLPAGTTFENDATDSEISFTLAGVYRHDNSTSSWGTNDAVKNAYPPITPDTHMNVWVCNIGGGILGYAQFPGGSPSTDGIVLGGAYFGNTSGNYGLGRTATHEVGHYLNLRHIWGDGACRASDFVDDTPSARSSNGGCPTFPSESCKSADMTMNYMDYTYDACMYMFTDGQRNRMRAIFASGGARATMAGN